MKYYKKIDGERIYLSPLCIDDAQTYTKWLCDRSVSDGIMATSKMYNVENEKTWITNNLENGDYSFAIILKDDDKLIGNCSIMKYNSISRTAELGIFIGEEEFRNKGYGQEALKLLLEYGFNILNLHNIDLGVFAFNERALACYKKIGFKEYGRKHECYFLDGKYHDLILLEMLEDDYRK